MTTDPRHGGICLQPIEMWHNVPSRIDNGWMTFDLITLVTNRLRHQHNVARSMAPQFWLVTHSHKDYLKFHDAFYPTLVHPALVVFRFLLRMEFPDAFM